jgi:uncharacterized membrane protein
VVKARSKIASAAIAVAILAWLLLLLGLVYAKFFVTDPPPNVVITFSDKGLTRLSAEALSLGIGCLGLILTLVAFAWAVRDRRLALATVGNAAVCAVCVALLM